ncbi:MAG: hypothetical protein IKI66_08675 [Bacteroidales bacterium]|nr:hypothetical protein [Bacteroidales bacterium]
MTITHRISALFAWVTAGLLFAPFAKQAQNPKIQSTDNQWFRLSVFAPRAEIRLWRRISKTLDLIISGLRNLGVRLFGGRVFLGRRRTGPSLSRSILAGRKPWIRMDNHSCFHRPPDFGADPFLLCGFFTPFCGQQVYSSLNNSAEKEKILILVFG